MSTQATHSFDSAKIRCRIINRLLKHDELLLFLELAKAMFMLVEVSAQYFIAYIPS